MTTVHFSVHRLARIFLILLPYCCRCDELDGNLRNSVQNETILEKPNFRVGVEVESKNNDLDQWHRSDLKIEGRAASSTYQPGRLSVSENGVLLSRGLSSRVIAKTGEKVRYADGSKSRNSFHTRPDGAAVFKHPRGDGWIYVSNAESRRAGGVGAITFDRKGRAIHYDMILKGTKRNCQGGVTPWNTWVSCEEMGKKRGDTGQCYETDPTGRRRARRTKLGQGGGNFEAVACDDRDKKNLKFFVTNDETSGELRRFTPDSGVMRRALRGDADKWDILSSRGKLEYLVLKPGMFSRGSGKFSWTTNLSKGKRSASEHFRRCEGMEFYKGKLYILSSTQLKVIILDLDKGTYETKSTVTRERVGMPDVLSMHDGIIYFTDESKKDLSGVYGMDRKGNIFTILRSQRLRGDATGLAFSPDQRIMYVAFQQSGVVLEVKRDDGKSFDGSVQRVRYHDIR